MHVQYTLVIIHYLSPNYFTKLVSRFTKLASRLLNRSPDLLNRHHGVANGFTKSAVITFTKPI